MTRFEMEYPMNTKELIAAEIAKVVPELEQENIQNLLGNP